MKWIVIFCYNCLFSALFFAVNYAVADEEKTHAFEPIFRVLASGTLTTLDPQKSGIFTDHELSIYLFDPLFTLKQGEPIPVLVDSYEWQLPTRWLFTLKKGVLFHDGSELTSRDVVATFNRAYRLKNNTYSNIKGSVVTALDTYRFQIDTAAPYSELLWSLEDVFIIKHTAEKLGSDEFDGEQLIGTGPYRFVERQGLKRLTLEAFMDYHRGAAYIRNIHFKSESDCYKRGQAFLRGEVDLVNTLTSEQLSKLDGKANITSLANNMLYFMTPDLHRDVSPDIRDNNGMLMQKNPLKDLRVRQAISKALDRKALVKKYFGSDSLAEPAGQLVNSVNRSYSPTMRPDEQSLVAARKLLKEAGYPDGFHITLRDKDARRGLIELIAEMLEDVGIQVKVETLPARQFFPKAINREYSLIHSGYTTDGNLAGMLEQLLHTKGIGNNGGYSNSELDLQIDDGMMQTSTARKRRKLRKAQEMAVSDLAVIPIMFPQKSWAIRPDMVFKPTDQLFTEAYYVEPLL